MVGIALHPDLAFGILLHHDAAAYPAIRTSGFKAFSLVILHATLLLSGSRITADLADYTDFSHPFYSCHSGGNYLTGNPFLLNDKTGLYGFGGQNDNLFHLMLFIFPIALPDL
jgi:hypothetical protein